MTQDEPDIFGFFACKMFGHMHRFDSTVLQWSIFHSRISLWGPVNYWQPFGWSHFSFSTLWILYIRLLPPSKPRMDKWEHKKSFHTSPPLQMFASGGGCASKQRKTSFWDHTDVFSLCIWEAFCLLYAPGLWIYGRNKLWSVKESKATQSDATAHLCSLCLIKEWPWFRNSKTSDFETKSRKPKVSILLSTIYQWLLLVCFLMSGPVVFLQSAISWYLRSPDSPARIP